MFAFLAVLFVLMVIYFFTEQRQKEGFNPVNTCPSHKINIPQIIPPTPALNPSVNPSDLPGKLPVAPYQQIAAMSPLPYQDTTLIKANQQQLVSMLEMLKGFLAFEAQEISERSDPTIQLPLTTARSDFHTLQSEVEVLNRNPGLQPTITLSHLGEISSNLAYLQNQVRLIGAAGTIQGPVYEFTQMEGFTVPTGTGATGVTGVTGAATGTKYTYTSNPQMNIYGNDLGCNTLTNRNRLDKYRTQQDIEKKCNSDPTCLGYTLYDDGSGLKPLCLKSSTNVIQAAGYTTYIKGAAPAAATAVTATTAAITPIPTPTAAGAPPAGTPPTGTPPAGTTGTTPTTAGGIASPADLENFILKINAEILRLSASATTDPNVQVRIRELTKIKNDVQTILNQVNSGSLQLVEIPIMKADIDAAFPILGDQSKPLPQIIKTLGLPPWLANLLGPNISNDPEITRKINKLIDTYADTIINNMSASFSVNYASPNSVNSTIANTGFPSMDDLNSVCGQQGSQWSQQGPHQGPQQQQMSQQQQGSQQESQQGSQQGSQPDSSQNPQDAGRGPSHFDWKSRAKQIEDQVKKRNLNPADFGIMPANTKVSDDFSWKGYTYMMCTRLQTTPDPGLPQTCGCPPMNWPGWRIAK